MSPLLRRLGHAVEAPRARQRSAGVATSPTMATGGQKAPAAFLAAREVDADLAADGGVGHAQPGRRAPRRRARRAGTAPPRCRRDRSSCRRRRRSRRRRARRRMAAGGLEEPLDGTQPLVALAGADRGRGAPRASAAMRSGSARPPRAVGDDDGVPVAQRGARIARERRRRRGRGRARPAPCAGPWGWSRRTSASKRRRAAGRPASRLDRDELPRRSPRAGHRASTSHVGGAVERRRVRCAGREARRPRSPSSSGRPRRGAPAGPAAPRPARRARRPCPASQSAQRLSGSMTAPPPVAMTAPSHGAGSLHRVRLDLAEGGLAAIAG